MLSKLAAATRDMADILPHCPLDTQRDTLRQLCEVVERSRVAHSLNARTALKGGDVVVFEDGGNRRVGQIVSIKRTRAIVRVQLEDRPVSFSVPLEDLEPTEEAPPEFFFSAAYTANLLPRHHAPTVNQ